MSNPAVADAEDVLRIERPSEHVVVLTLNQPDRLNPIGGELRRRLTEVWPMLDADPTVRVIVLTGAGRAFCSGADLERRAEGNPLRDESTDDVDAIESRGIAGYQGAGARLYPRFTARQALVYKPVITAVNGVCAGAGLHFVADSDVVICSENATFVDTHVNVGQVTAVEPIGLSRRIPLGAVLRMVCMGRYERLNAQRAYELGLVSEVVPADQLLSRALELAALIAKASPETLRVSLKAVWESLEHGLTHACYAGYRPLVEHWDHPDAQEGPRAFMEKREPKWSTDR